MPVAPYAYFYWIERNHRGRTPLYLHIHCGRSATAGRRVIGGECILGIFRNTSGCLRTVGITQTGRGRPAVNDARLCCRAYRYTAAATGYGNLIRDVERKIIYGDGYLIGIATTADRLGEGKGKTPRSRWRKYRCGAGRIIQAGSRAPTQATRIPGIAQLDAFAQADRRIYSRIGGRIDRRHHDAVIRACTAIGIRSSKCIGDGHRSGRNRILYRIVIEVYVGEPFITGQSCGGIIPDIYPPI